MSVNNRGNNAKILDEILNIAHNRLDLGIVKFKQEMPLDEYSEIDILDEVVDAMIYSSSLLVHLKERKENNEFK